VEVKINSIKRKGTIKSQSAYMQASLNDCPLRHEEGAVDVSVDRGVEEKGVVGVVEWLSIERPDESLTPSLTVKPKKKTV